MKNIYLLYEENGRKCPFTVIRHTWSKTAFVVESIGGEMYGALPGKPPYYGNPPVQGHYINTATGETIPDNYNNGGIVSCPGLYQWAVLP
jgi:hypothetical protein